MSQIFLTQGLATISKSILIYTVMFIDIISNQTLNAHLSNFLNIDEGIGVP